MSGYNTLAWFYDKYWTKEAPNLFFNLLKRYLLLRIDANSKILDLCCGTGQMSSMLSEAGYKITGIDNSCAMIDMARANAPKANFLVGDAANLESVLKNESFDAVISLFDSINHLLDIDGLNACFKGVYNALKPDGYFLFDVNDIDTFLENWTGGFSSVEDDNACILRPVFNIKTGLATYYTTMFKKEGDSWLRTDSTVYEQYYSDETILRSLKDAGFLNVHVADGHEDLGVIEFAGRRFFIAKK